MADLDAQPRAITVITDETSREALVIMLNAENHRAKRVVPKVGSDDHPTAHDLHHRRINEMLSDWQAAR